MTPRQFAFLQRFLEQRSGLNLAPEKRYLVESRLSPVAQQAGFSTLADFVVALSRGVEPDLEARAVEAMTINESSFFRDRVPFEHFTEFIVPDLESKRAFRRGLRIWCAAAAAGQEPYSLAMQIRESLPRLADWRIDLLASDLSAAMVARGVAGRYSQFEVQRGLPIHLLVRYFERRGDAWQIDDTLRRMVRWRVLNLLSSLDSLGQFDVVFCRNVLIYFSRATKADVLSRLVEVVAPDGYLVLGAAESVVGLCDGFVPVPGVHGVYRPRQKRPVQQSLRVAAAQ